jgi:hypothetical protein
MQTMNMTDYWTATAVAATKAPVVIYGEDGSMYEGRVNESGEKHGTGIFKTAIYISGIVGDDNSHLSKWTEFEGQWCNGLLHGQGVMRNMTGNGVVRIVHDGMWDTGVPVKTPDREIAERLIMASLTTSQEFDLIDSFDQNAFPWTSD